MKNGNKIKKRLFPFHNHLIPAPVIYTIFISVCLLTVFLLSSCSALDNLLSSSHLAGNKNDSAQGSLTESAAGDDSSKQQATGQGQGTAEESVPGTQETGDATETTKQQESTDSEVTINVYYAEATGEYLIGEARIVSGKNKYVDAIAEMMKDPVDPSLLRLIPETTKINGITLDGSQAKVDLSQNFVDDRFISDSSDILLVYSIVNTLTGFKEIHSVQFFIDGQKLDVLGMLDLSEPLFRRSDLIKSG